MKKIKERFSNVPICTTKLMNLFFNARRSKKHP